MTMEWTYLGHAMWLVVAEGLRFVCDPILRRTHHGDVFEVIPPREVKPESLRPDFILVSHRHGDHFDVPSLNTLAMLDAETVVITPDRLVASTCLELGFRTVHRVAPGQHVQLDSVALVTTPSVDTAEWGVAFATASTCVWNQVDTVFESSSSAAKIAQETLDAVGKPHFDLVLTAGGPMLEVAAQLGSSSQFPYLDYGQRLQEIAAVPAQAVVPSASASAHVAAGWLNAWVYPVSTERFCRDLEARCPHVRVLRVSLGDCLRVEPNGIALTSPRRADYLTLLEREANGTRRRFAPFSMPAIADGNTTEHSPQHLVAFIEAWLINQLAPALRAAFAHWGLSHSVQLQVDLVCPDAVEHFVFHVDNTTVTLSRQATQDWDAINIVAASALYKVLTGQLHWGDVLLSGNLRGRTRAYHISTGEVVPAPIAELFLYYGLPYEASEEQATRTAVANCLASRSTALTP